jgi:hypothetical protein
MYVKVLGFQFATKRKRQIGQEEEEEDDDDDSIHEGMTCTR